MPNFIQNYNINSFYICIILLLYNAYKSNFEYINIILNYNSIIIIINIIGLYLFLKNLTFEININCSLKYK